MQSRRLLRLSSPLPAQSAVSDPTTGHTKETALRVSTGTLTAGNKWFVFVRHNEFYQVLHVACVVMCVVVVSMAGGCVKSVNLWDHLILWWTWHQALRTVDEVYRTVEVGLCYFELCFAFASFFLCPFA